MSEEEPDVEYSAAAFKKFKFLWKVDDKDWVQIRKAEWKQLRETSFSDWSAQELKYYSKFYVYGEEIKNYSKVNFSIGYAMRLYLMPCDTIEQAKEIYFTIPAQERKNLVSYFLVKMGKYLEDLPNTKFMIHSYAQAVFGGEYKKVEESNGKRAVVTSPSPTGFCMSYVVAAITLMNEENSYNYSVDPVDYFVSALAFADCPKQRKRIKLDKLISMVSQVIALPEKYNEITNELAQKLKAKESKILSNWAIHAGLDK